ncbi:aspartyl/asparaginyl beta-hydroxylase domain-containing protein [Lysobacter sp. HA35]
MKLHAPFIQLPLRFDAEALAREVDALGEDAWMPHPQGFAGNSMLPLVAVDGNPHDESFTGVMRPTPALQRSPYLRRVFASLGATVGRSRLMRLSGHAEVTRHADQFYYWAERVRVHVPIVTQPTVRFECGGAAINMAAGECWIFDTWRQHRVLNDAVESRVHLVVDTVGGGAFWDFVARGRRHDERRADWSPTLIAPGEGDADVEFACEARNLPTVMSPWEMTSLFGLLFSHAVPHPAWRAVHELTARFAREWQGLWFEFGDEPVGRERFRDALRRYVDAVTPISQSLALDNELAWHGAMLSTIAQVAVRPDAA